MSNDEREKAVRNPDFEDPHDLINEAAAQVPRRYWPKAPEGMDLLGIQLHGRELHRYPPPDDFVSRPLGDGIEARTDEEGNVHYHDTRNVLARGSGARLYPTEAQIEEFFKDEKSAREYLKRLEERAREEVRIVHARLDVKGPSFHRVTDEQIEAAEDLRSAGLGEYGTILADPPWQFLNRTGKMAPGAQARTRAAQEATGGGGADNMKTALVREIRIMESCVHGARRIIAELETSGGDHREDAEVLDGLIETWEHLRDVAASELVDAERGGSS